MKDCSPGLYSSSTYEIELLQDHMVDTFRKYHQQYNITFQDLHRLVKRLGNSLGCHNVPLVRYLARQIADDLNTKGYDKILDSNINFHLGHLLVR